MFDVGFWEIALISLIALIILGPERLPRAARSLGVWVGKARRMLAEVKRDIDRELDEADLKKIRDIKDEVKETVQDSKKMFEDASLKKDLDDAKSALEETASTLNENISDEPEQTAKPPESQPKPKKAKKPRPVSVTKDEAPTVDEPKTVA